MNHQNIKKEHPIIFSPPMVKAILQGRKFESRRIIKPQPFEHQNGMAWKDHLWGTDWQWQLLTFSPYGKPGDLLWVREQHRWADKLVDGFERTDPYYVQYWADGSVLKHTDLIATGAVHPTLRVKVTDPHWAKGWSTSNKFGRWRAGMHMPRWACRLLLRVEGLAVERVGDITKKGACAEGVHWSEAFPEGYTTGQPHDYTTAAPTAVYSFRKLWNGLYAKPIPVRRKKQIVRYESYPFKDGTEVKNHRGKPWHAFGNPYVWVVKFSIYKLAFNIYDYDWIKRSPGKQLLKELDEITPNEFKKLYYGEWE